MRFRSRSATRSAALTASIRDTENRLRRHQNDIGLALGNVAHIVRKRMTSPGAIIAAGLFGAALHREHRLHGLRALATLQAVNTGLRILFAVTSGRRTSPDQPGSSPATHS